MTTSDSEKETVKKMSLTDLKGQPDEIVYEDYANPFGYVYYNAVTGKTLKNDPETVWEKAQRARLLNGIDEVPMALKVAHLKASSCLS